MPGPFALLDVRGDDAVAFLQSQLTCDLADLDPRRLIPAAWCDPSGRVLAFMMIAGSEGHVTLMLPAAVSADVQRRMSMFTIGRDAEVTSGGPARLADDDSGTAWTAPGGRGVDRDIDREGDERGPGDAASMTRWTGDDLRHMLPWILPATSGRFLPQMLGLDALGGISFRKGCYPGQEIVARVHYRGRVTRRAALFSLDGGPPPEPGEELVTVHGAGTVLYAVGESEKGRTLGLAVVPAESASGETVRHRASSGVVLEIDHAVLASGT
ncbi:MAG: hypothetical protein R3323_04110 [Wenzhouxiangellaceae bacterium]|nr:hypothetical protein [Wenzhouxiangellaceae bacterium]